MISQAARRLRQAATEPSRSRVVRYGNVSRAGACTPARPISRSGVEQRHRVVPKTYVDPDILADRTNRSGTTATARRGTSLQAAGDEIFLYDVIGQPQRVA